MVPIVIGRRSNLDVAGGTVKFECAVEVRTFAVISNGCSRHGGTCTSLAAGHVENQTFLCLAGIHEAIVTFFCLHDVPQAVEVGGFVVVGDFQVSAFVHIAVSHAQVAVGEVLDGVGFLHGSHESRSVLQLEC